MCEKVQRRLNTLARGAQDAQDASTDDLCMDWQVSVPGVCATSPHNATMSTSKCSPAYSLSLRKDACDDAFAVCASDDLAQSVAEKLAPLLARSASEVKDAHRRKSARDLHAIQFAKRVRVVFSLLNEDASAGGAASGWELQETLKDLGNMHGALPPRLEAIAPLFRLIEAARGVHDFQLESQVQWYAPLEFEPTAEHHAPEAAPEAPEHTRAPEQDSSIEAAAAAEHAEHAQASVDAELATRTPAATEHFASLDNVRVFVNSAQWNLESYGLADAASNATEGQFEEQTLHFVLFLPSDAHRPLRIRNPTTSETIANPAWIVPQWGGVVVWNREGDGDRLAPPLTLDELAEPLRLFSKQLAQLLGVAFEQVSDSESALYFAVQGLLWRRTLESARSTIETLGSTVRLVDKIPNLGVGTTVRGQFLLALERLNELAALLGADTQQDILPKALDLAYSAQAHASRAFFDPSMLAMLYFPDEHKYAVYTPLFGPLFVPLLVALVREAKRFRARRAQHTLTKQSNT